VVDRAFNENVFADDDRPYLQLFGWQTGGATGHSFSDLEESDRADFVIDCGSAGSYNVTLDYIEKDCPSTGQYQSGAQAVDTCYTNPDDRLATPLNAAATSLYYNMTTAGWTDETHSPPPDYNNGANPYYEWHMIYEFSAPLSGLGVAACSDCKVTQAGAHNSPHKEQELSSLGDTVWLDEDGDGIQDSGEGGVGGVTVELYASDGTTLLQTTTTEYGTGYYVFTNLAAGDYYVKFIKPAGYDFTTQDAQAFPDPDDSDADELTGWTALITLPSNTHDPDWDAGLVTGGATAVTLSSFAAGSSVSAFATLSLGLALLAAAGGLLWVRRRSG
jgi:hypothetical protein